MQLGLHFENIMDEKEYDEQQKTTNKTSKKSKTQENVDTSNIDVTKLSGGY